MQAAQHCDVIVDCFNASMFPALLLRPLHHACLIHNCHCLMRPFADAAAVQCAEMLPRSLCTVAPRVAFYQHQRPGQPLPRCNAFTDGDQTFCKRLKADPLEFAAFKAGWLASEEGREVCRHEGKQPRQR